MSPDRDTFIECDQCSGFARGQRLAEAGDAIEV